MSDKDWTADEAFGDGGDDDDFNAASFFAAAEELEGHEPATTTTTPAAADAATTAATATATTATTGAAAAAAAAAAATPQQGPLVLAPPTLNRWIAFDDVYDDPTLFFPGDAHPVWESVDGEVRLNGHPFHIKGISWFGIETDTRCVARASGGGGCWRGRSAAVLFIFFR